MRNRPRRPRRPAPACRVVRGAGEPVGSSHKTALAIRMAVMPSARAWWMRQIRALPPPGRRGITSIRHSGRERSRCWAKMAATVALNPASSPAPDAGAASTTWAAMSTCWAGTHHGAPSISPSRIDSMGARAGAR